MNMTTPLQLSVIALAVTLPLTALGQTSEADASTTEAICREVSLTAETVMQARQDGVLMRTMMERLAGLPDDDATTVLRAMIAEAFDVPRYSTPEVQARAVSEFDNSWYALCYQRRSKGIEDRSAPQDNPGETP